MEELQNRLTQLEEEKSKLDPNVPDDAFRIRQINSEIDQIQEQIKLQQSIEQEQATDLDDIQLPADYNTLFDDQRANDEIKALIKQTKEQAYAYMNTKLAEVIDEYQAKLADAQTQIDNLEASLQTANASLQQATDENEQLTAKLQEEQLLRQDAEQKRDNAAQELLSAQSERDAAIKEAKSYKDQVDELESIVSQYKKAERSSKTFSLNLTSSLAAKPKSRQEEEIERLNRNLEKYGVKPLQLPAQVTDQQIKDQAKIVEEAANEAAQFQTVVSSDGTGSETQAGAGEALGNASAASQTLEERVSALEKAVFGKSEVGVA